MNDKVTPIRAVNALSTCNPDLAQAIRRLADEIEAGDYGDLGNVVCVLEGTDGQLSCATYGRPCDLARVVGLLHIAAHRATDGAC